MNRRTLLEQMIADDPNDPFLYYGLALECIKEQIPGEAEKLFDLLLERFPEYLPSYYQFGQLLEKKGEIEGAIAIYQKGVVLAIEQRDLKTKSELEEALWELED